MNREEKATVVEELNGKFVKAKIAIVSDAEIRVAKNTLLRRAVEGTEFEGIVEACKGTTAVTMSYEDPVAPAKVVVDFAKDHPQLTIRAACMDGKALSADDLVVLSKLPSREALLASLLSVMNGVPTSFVRVLNGVPTKMVYALNAIGEQKGQA